MLSGALLVDHQPDLPRPLAQVVLDVGDAGEGVEVLLHLPRDRLRDRVVVSLQPHRHRLSHRRPASRRQRAQLDHLLRVLLAHAVDSLLHQGDRLLGSEDELLPIHDGGEGHGDVGAGVGLRISGDGAADEGGVVDQRLPEQIVELTLDLAEDLVGAVQTVVRRGLEHHEEVVVLGLEEHDGEVGRHARGEDEQRHRERAERQAVSQDHVERAQVEPPQPADSAVDPQVHRPEDSDDAPETPARLRPCLRGVPAPQIEIVGGQDDQALEEGRDQTDDHGLGEDRNELARRPPDQQQREEGRAGGRDRRGHRPHHLLGALDDGVPQGLSLLDAPVDVLEHDDRVVDEHARDQEHADQRHRVDADVHQREEDERGQEAEGNRDDGERRVPEADGEPENRHHQHDAGQQVVPEHGHPRGDPLRRIPDHAQLDTLGNGLSLRLDPAPHTGRDIDRSASLSLESPIMSEGLPL